MDCERIQEELPAYQDKELPEPRMASIRSHLAGCANCRGEMKALTETWGLLGSLEPVQPSADFRARFWERIRQEAAQHRTLWERLALGRSPTDWRPPTGRFGGRFTPVLAGVMALWILGIAGGVLLFERRLARGPDPGRTALEIFTSPYPPNSIEQIYLGRNL